MSLDTVLEGLAELGLRPYLDVEGNPRLRGPADEITGAVKEALAAYRDELLERLRVEAPARPVPSPAAPEATTPAPPTAGDATLPAPPREWAWLRGHSDRELPGDAYFGDRDWHPAGAWWWRFRGETKFRPVPGRPGAWMITAEAPA